MDVMLAWYAAKQVRKVRSQEAQYEVLCVPHNGEERAYKPRLHRPTDRERRRRVMRDQQSTKSIWTMATRSPCAKQSLIWGAHWLSGVKSLSTSSIAGPWPRRSTS
eukprot:6128460-Amphidinium_carterae.1